MRIVLSGGRGRLGKLVAPALRAAGHDVHAPPRRSCDWTCPAQARRALAGADAVLALAAWTDVVGAQHQPAAAVRDTVATTQATLQAARARVRVFYVSTDYVLGLLRGQYGVGVYAAADWWLSSWCWQLVGTWPAWRSPPPPSRCRAGRGSTATASAAAAGPTSWCRSWCAGAPGTTCSPACRTWAATAPCTAEELLRSRYPEHPALQHVLRTPQELASKGVHLRPPDTTWDWSAPPRAAQDRR